MRTVLSDPEVAWHIRSFESWGSRLSFRDWKGYDLGHDDDSDEGSEPASSGLLLEDGFWKRSELHYYKDYPVTQMYAHAGDAKEMMDEVQQGHDKALKAILLAHCPRLRSLACTHYHAEDE